MTDKRARVLSTIFALSWLGILAIYIQDILSPHPQVHNIPTFLPLLGTYVTVYALFWIWGIYTERVAVRAVLVATLVVLNTVMFLVSGDAAGSLFTYGVVVAGAAFPWRYSLVAVVLITTEVLVGAHSSDNDWIKAGAVALQELLFGLGTVAVSVLIRTIIALREARDDLARLAIAGERIRFARDLHDLLGHSLSVVVLKSELAQSLLERDPRRAAQELREMEQVARDALRDVRAAVTGYRQTNLASELYGAREMLESAGIACRLEEQSGPLPEATESALAWAVREGATNVLRHSQARECLVRLTREDDVAMLEIVDDGLGAGDTGTGNGLRGLGERVEAIGGEVVAGRDNGRGFRLTVRVPAT
ncbi:MAG: two-component system, NarL family, sensor histidine kinase DesK [Chloroflexota bacterium]|jgi:two-component system sensor histidine kinase DesK|nr:two-component system, NarL family, sensor histidine kinase DesK [Chloroflexota bacterium]